VGGRPFRQPVPIIWSFLVIWALFQIREFFQQ